MYTKLDSKYKYILQVSHWLSVQSMSKTGLSALDTATAAIQSRFA